jgi:chromosome segregation ATPase
MARRSSKSSTDVQKLLEERQAITKWLERLSLAGDSASDDVRTKVRADYEARLEAVSKELQGYAKELRETLSKEETKQEDLTERERAADIRLAEAKLRHAVGEYDDAQWNKIHSEIMGELVKLREELKGVGDEVTRLQEALVALDRKPAVQPDEERVSLAELDPDAEEAEVAELGEDEEAKATETGRQTDAFDELAFLKKVAPDGAGKRRRSGATFRPLEATPSQSQPVHTPKPETALSSSGETPSLGPKEDETARKTLKCEECGAMNRPTEWYCESCGAELADL